MIPALERQSCPVHSVSVPSGWSTTERAGLIVKQRVEVPALDPGLASISQLMFCEGE